MLMLKIHMVFLIKLLIILRWVSSFSYNLENDKACTSWLRALHFSASFKPLLATRISSGHLIAGYSTWQAGWYMSLEKPPDCFISVEMKTGCGLFYTITLLVDMGTLKFQQHINTSQNTADTEYSKEIKHSDGLIVLSIRLLYIMTGNSKKTY